MSNKIMKMKKYIVGLMTAFMGISLAGAQKVMTPPHVLIVPDMTYCKQNGFTQTFDNM